MTAPQQPDPRQEAMRLITARRTHSPIEVADMVAELDDVQRVVVLTAMTEVTLGLAQRLADITGLPAEVGVDTVLQSYALNIARVGE